jgi:hypothetical protein
VDEASLPKVKRGFQQPLDHKTELIDESVIQKRELTMVYKKPTHLKAVTIAITEGIHCYLLN